ncbi:MAG: hypothetical protein H6606_06855 [Flavobacteriales bacterium]|nr:hypothetical protein [Flavobacteriales bacterium]
MKIILGIHVSHDSSACLIAGNQVIGAIQEERLSRIKFHEGFPYNAILSLLNQHGLQPSQIHFVAIAGANQEIEHPFFNYEHSSRIKYPLRRAISKLAASIAGRTGLRWFDGLIYQRSGYRKYVLDNLKLIGFDLNKTSFGFYDHHLCHAASAYYPSGYKNALILTQDGRGDGLSGSVYKGQDEKLELMQSQLADHSVAQLYAEVTQFLGYKPLRHEGKITGLAAFGNGTVLAQHLHKLFQIDNNGSISKLSISGIDLSKKLDSKSLRRKRATVGIYQTFANWGRTFSIWLGQNFSNTQARDVAAGIQDFTEEIIAKHTEKVLDTTLTGDQIAICVSGGLFANVKLNQRIRESARVENLFVQPAMGDCGLSLGAACLANLEQNASRINPVDNQYLGTSYTDEEIIAELANWEREFQWEFDDQIAQTIAQHIHQGQIVGRFAGAMEFGPRALGNRSILLHPCDKSMNDVVNKRLNRTEFMPFAPSVLDYWADHYFSDYNEKHRTAEWMTTTYNVKPEMIESIQAVVHIDGTARPQIVKKEQNESYYSILQEYEKISGIGCLVNTSFNMHEEPIVESPKDALRAFQLGSVDILAIGNIIVSRKTD